MNLIKIITKDNEYYFNEDKIEYKHKLKTKTNFNISSYLVNDTYIVISSDKIIFECEKCRAQIASIYSNFKNRKHYLCVSCTRKKTVTEVHKNLSENERLKRNKIVSIKTKEAMNNISPQRRKEMTKKMVSSMNWDERNKKWNQTMQSKSEDEKIRIRNKVKKTWLKKYGVSHISQNREILEKQMKSREDSWKLKSYSSIFGELTYQTQHELQFIKFCEKNNVFIKDGPTIDYELNEKTLKYTIDFETSDYLIEIKQDHIWYKEDLESGKIDAKNEAAQNYAASLNKNFLFLLNIRDYSKFIH